MSSIAEETKYDSVYLGIVQSQKGIDNIIGTFFGFLRRKTDFFSQEERAKEIVLNHTRTQCAIFQRELELEAAARAARAAAPAPAPKPAVSAPRAAPAAAAPPAPTRPRIEEVRDEPEASAAAAAGGPTDADKDAATEIPSVDASAEGDPKKKPNHGNGGDTDKYIWQQTLEDVTIFIPVPPGTRSRDIDCEIKALHIRFGLKGQPPMINAALPKRVAREDCTWSIDTDSFVVTVFLQKESDMEWWKQIAEGEPDIDTSKVVPENSKLSDLKDADTRTMVEKMMFDQRQTALGLPTSEDMKNRALLAKLQAAHPEMDFSKASFN